MVYLKRSSSWYGNDVRPTKVVTWFFNKTVSLIKSIAGGSTSRDTETKTKVGANELPPPAVYTFWNLHPVSCSRPADGCWNKRTTRRQGGEVATPHIYHVGGAALENGRLRLRFISALRSLPRLPLRTNHLLSHTPDTCHPHPNRDTNTPRFRHLTRPSVRLPFHIKQEAAGIKTEKLDEKLKIPCRFHPCYYLSNGY